MKTLKNMLLVMLCAFVALAMFAGCSNDGVPSPLKPEPIINKEVAGMTLYRNGGVVAVMDKSGIQGTVTAQINENSDIFEVEFFDKNGEIVNGELQYHNLSWIQDTEYATFEQFSKWKFGIYGKRAGETAFEVLLENGAGVEYQSPDILLELK